MEKRKIPLLSSAVLTILLINLHSSAWACYLMLFVACVFLVMAVRDVYKRIKSIKENRKQPTLKA